MNKLIFVLLMLPCFVKAQKGVIKNVGTAEKLWALTHPFKIKKAYGISEQVLQEMDSLKRSGYFSKNTLSGSKADAVRHAYWMGRLSREIGAKKALKLGVAHEKKNKKDFMKGMLEEAFVPDLTSVVMDLHNNEVGASTITMNGGRLLNVVLELLSDGRLLYIKQNEAGAFLDKTGKIIPLKDWSGKWENDRTLVPTNL